MNWRGVGGLALWGLVIVAAVTRETPFEAIISVLVNPLAFVAYWLIGGAWPKLHLLRIVAYVYGGAISLALVGGLLLWALAGR